MSGSGFPPPFLPAGLAAEIKGKRVDPQTLVPGRLVSESDLLDLSDIDTARKWHERVVAIHFVCSFGVPETTRGASTPSQLVPYGSSGLPGSHGAVGQPPSHGALAPSGRVMAPPAQTPPMQWPTSTQLAGAQGQMPVQPLHSVSQPMSSPYAMYGQPQAMYGQPQAMYGQAQAMYGQTQVMYGQPQMSLSPTAYSPPMVSGQYPMPSSQGGYPGAPPAPVGTGPSAQSSAVGPPTDRPVAFHLRLFFEFATKDSIELHERSSGMADNKAVATYRRYVVTNRDVFDKHVIRPAIPFTMTDVKATVFDRKRRHLYRFVNGTGCAYWALKVIEDLENAGMLAAGSTENSAAAYREWARRRNKEHELPYRPAKGQWL